MLSEEVEDLVRCSVCFEKFTNPKTLPCAHTFCENCLIDWVMKKREEAEAEGVDKREFGCPECRALFTAETNDSIKEMKCWHVIRNMLDIGNMQQQAKENNLVCSQCQEKGISYCSDC